jgi:hypothetical protein
MRSPAHSSSRRTAHPRSGSSGRSSITSWTMSNAGDGDGSLGSAPRGAVRPKRPRRRSEAAHVAERHRGRVPPGPPGEHLLHGAFELPPLVISAQSRARMRIDLSGAAPPRRLSR